MADMKETSFAQLENDFQVYLEKIGGPPKLTTHELRFMRSAFEYGFGCGMEFTINDLRRRGVKLVDDNSTKEQDNSTPGE